MPDPDTLRGLAQQLDAVARAHPCYSQVDKVVFVLLGTITALARIQEINQDQARPQQELAFNYVNYRGQTGRRKVRPLSIRWGTSDWYKTPQWLLSCWDLDKDDMREFAIANMTDIVQENRP